MEPTLREILALPVLQAGEPEILCNGPLDISVRWVHASDLADLSDLLEGGELVLSTGQALTDVDRRDAYLPALTKAGAVGVVIELGIHLDALPSSVLEVGRTLSFPVIVLHRRVRFVEVTEDVHRRIVAEQYAEVDYARRVHEAFTSLSMRRATVDDIVAAAAGMLATPVVLEDLNRQVLAFTANGVPTVDLLADWDRRSRLAPVTGPGSWTARPVGPCDQEWGRLVAPYAHGADDRTAMTLERAAQALALHRMVEQDRTSLELRAQSGLVDELRRGRIRDEAEATARAYALGLRPALTYVPLSARLRESASADQVLVQQRRVSTLDAIMQAIRSAGHTGLAATRGDGQIDLLLAPHGSAPSGAAAVAERTALAAVCTAIRRAVTRVDGIDDCIIGVAPASSRLVDAAGGLIESGHVAEVAMAMPASERPFFRSSDVRLRGLVGLIRSDPRVQAFAESELRGILADRARHGDGAYDLLRKFLEAGGNKSELAKRLRISRPTLYARLAAVERLLGVDLDSAESRTSLHVAMLVLERGHRIDAYR